ncbi:LacI family DNA-binding transcriptional regulator [Actomonas aquatica]|uniref:LacI family DNA-binding transcriptional regulator n=1 Tax=Actomonas aquatica TaxID=2866162 RepID=A0ABZ1CDZ2_9BACT|nr:LacI family DNA-binding transcriptional regulator [Opitutus sp. WL0086]WRQ89585.1 LacI family DNA-binding transcriptional regulator [Opitutus sp. WL0086]
MLISEIAKQARVSPSTVSRAINQPDIVAPGSLERIRAVMKKFNYTPAPINRRRGPKSKKPTTLNLGVWFVGAKADNPSLNWFQERMAELRERGTMNRVDLSMLFSNSPGELPRALTEGNLDGVIIQGMAPTAAVMQKLKNMPCVWFMTRRSYDFPGDYVEPNNEENGRVAAEYLAQQGHKSVAVLTTDPSYSANVRRVKAFMERAEELGLKAHSILGEDIPGVSFLEIAPLNSEIEQLVNRLVHEQPRPTGLYIPVDHFAGAFFRALRSAGLQPRKDFDVILGNFNPMIYNNLEHHPAAIDIQLSTLVRKVIDQLVWRIENRDAPGRIGITVSPTLRPAFD